MLMIFIIRDVLYEIFQMIINIIIYIYIYIKIYKYCLIKIKGVTFRKHPFLNFLVLNQPPISSKV